LMQQRCKIQELGHRMCFGRQPWRSETYNGQIGPVLPLESQWIEDRELMAREERVDDADHQAPSGKAPSPAPPAACNSKSHRVNSDLANLGSATFPPCALVHSFCAALHSIDAGAPTSMFPPCSWM